MRLVIDTEPEVPRRRVSLRARLLWACLLLVLAPVTVAWGMGLYDNLHAWFARSELSKLADKAVAEAVVLGLAEPSWLAQFSDDNDVYVRVINEAGDVVYATDPAYAEGHFARNWWFRGVANSFFGPGGPPDLASWEAQLGPLRARPEVRALSEGKMAAHKLRVTSKMLVFAHAQRVPGADHTLYLTRISRRSVRALYDFRYQMLKLTGGLLIGALVMGAWLAFHIVVPLSRLESGVQGYLRGQNRGSLILSRSDEIGALSRSFDRLRLRLQGRVEHSNRVTADFAHDLKSPLAAIRAASEILEGTNPMDPQRRARLAHSVGAAAQHMQRSIDALMELSKLETQLAEEPKTRFDFGTTVSRVIGSLKDDPRAQGLSLSFEIAANIYVFGNASRISQGVVNLLDNALVFAAKEVQVRLSLEDSEIVLTVRDDGPGVSEGNRERIFERFFTHRPEGAAPGTGLGLSIVRTVVEDHGGMVSVGAQGPGATFIVRLPSNCHEVA